MVRRPTLRFLRIESAAGAALAAAGAAALILANSPWAGRYFAFLAAPFTVRLGAFAHTLSVEAWVKGGLMALFFLVVGLEIKFEVRRGELSSPRRLALPLLAALGGMIVPALVYLAANLGPGGARGGWPIPTATDVAFALAALAVVAPRAPPALRVFLLTLAIADDLGAVGLIGIVYTTRIHPAPLAAAAIALAALALLSEWRRAPLVFYAVGFALVWAFTLESGLDTSLAGVACAFTVPIGARRPGEEGVAKRFMDSLQPYVSFGVLPLFAFTAAGFALTDLTAADAVAPLPVGIMLALTIGKPVGVFGFSLLGVAMRIARRPSGATWLEILGAAMLCGVGFTMSFYLGALAFPAGGPTGEQVRLGVIAGSLASVAMGAAALAWARRCRGEESISS